MHSGPSIFILNVLFKAVKNDYYFFVVLF